MTHDLKPRPALPPDVSPPSAGGVLEGFSLLVTTQPLRTRRLAACCCMRNPKKTLNPAA